MIGLLATVAVPDVAHGWDFTCSPRNVTEIEPLSPPNMMLMLDKSGSMDSGEVASTCRVCERPNGTLFEVASAGECTPTTGGWSRTLSGSQPSSPSVDGYSYFMDFAGLPPVTGVLELTITVQGDFDDSRDWYDLYVDGTFVRQVRVNRGCSRSHTFTVTVDKAHAADGALQVELRTAADTRFSDGVDSQSCTANKASVTVSNRTMTYHGTQQWEDPCGSMDKWQQAVTAIDVMTEESSARDPDLAAFGLGMFSGSTAAIYNECASDSHTDIMETLNAYGPGGSTPTALAIRTALASDCVQGTSSYDVTDTKSHPRVAGFEGFNYVHRLAVPPMTSDTTVEIFLQGDYSGTCEYADVYVDGVFRGHHNGFNQDCDTTPSSRSFRVPAADTADGEVVIEVRNRAVTSPGTSLCAYGTDGVDASCATNSSRVRLPVTVEANSTTATVLVTDGEPTVAYDGVDPYPAAVVAACAHREKANLYVVGQGSGTDVEFNNILAAAGGSGSCAGGVDPCDDPFGYESLRGQCTGAYQTSSTEDLLLAIAEITNAIQCIFDVDFSGAPVTDVPLDPSNSYPYLYIEGRFAASGLARMYHKDSPLAAVPGEGWEFASATESKRVRFTDYYCNMVQTREINQVATQLACLCTEETGTVCDVPNYQALGLCPTGVWACTEGVDVCVPDEGCCVAGLPCTVEGEQGVCAEGLTACPDPAGAAVCEQVNFPTEEVCNGLDDDCDGDIDEISGDCTVPDATGRCAVGTRACVDAAEVCLPLFGPMPELCNGLDDDCNGIDDDITRSWKNTFKDVYTLETAERGKACEIKNVCFCDAGVTDEHAGTTFDEYLAAWDNVCECGQGLEPMTLAPAPSPADDGGEPTPMAGCSTTSNSGLDAGLWGLLGLLGMGWKRRRR